MTHIQPFHHRPRLALILVALVASPVLAGCTETGEDEPQVQQDPQQENHQEPEELVKRLLAREAWRAAFGYTGSPSCEGNLPYPLEGHHGYILERQPGAPPINDSFASLVFTLRLDGVWSGVQLGYQYGDAAINWFPMRTDGEQRIEVSLDGQYDEPDGSYWTFYKRYSLGDVDTECSMGYFSGGIEAKVHASSESANTSDAT